MRCWPGIGWTSSATRTVGPALSLAEALALADGDFDAAILDVSLGADTSFALADRLMARGVPFAFATGYVADDGELGRRRRRPAAEAVRVRGLPRRRGRLLAARPP